MDDIALAKKYLSKAKSSADRGIEFTLSFSKYKKLYNAKICKYTGVRMTNDKGPYQRTIDRVDGSKGYSDDNTVACCHSANQAKNHILEMPKLSTKQVLNMLKVVDSLCRQQGKQTERA